MKIHILHTNDMHNHFPARLLQELKRTGSILLDSGDALAGSNTVFHFKEPVFRAMRDMGYRAMAMGNREFHYLRGILGGRLRQAGFPILSANVSDLRGKLNIRPSVTISAGAGALKIGIFGLTVPQYPAGSLWEKISGWRFLDVMDAAGSAVASLRRSGAPVIFCLSHLGFRMDKILAEKVKGIHVIFGGHSHTILPAPVRVNETAIVQGGSHGKFVGNWEFEDGKLNGGLTKNPHA